MAQECREELTLVEADTLLDTLEAYLQKHRYPRAFQYKSEDSDYDVAP